MAVDQSQRFSVGDKAIVLDTARPQSWHNREVNVLRFLPADAYSGTLYDVDFTDPNGLTAEASFWDNELKPLPAPDTRTIKINVDLDFDVETMVSNLRSSIAQSLRALADEIEEPQ